MALFAFIMQRVMIAIDFPHFEIESQVSCPIVLTRTPDFNLIACRTRANNFKKFKFTSISQLILDIFVEH